MGIGWIRNIVVAICCSLTIPLLASKCAAAGQVIYVTDGDTIHVDGVTYRLEGIDAPETKQTCTNSAGKPFRCGLEATRLLRDLLKGNVVHCIAPNTDRYGRFLGHCNVGKLDINEEMVARGYARAFVKYSGEYLADEETAMLEHRGLWTSQWQAPWDWRADQLKANNSHPGQCVIKGNIGKKGRVYYLPFHSSYSRVKISPNKGEKWFCKEDEAIASGWRRAD